MKISNLFACLVTLATPSLVAQVPATEEMFPFVIPGLAAPPAGSAVDVSWLNERPAGGHGFVRARGGHFVDGTGKRFRFLASNFTFGSCFPDHDTADQLATRLASLGINCIRFHHIDNQEAPRGIWKAGTPKKNELDPDQLDRLDYFIAALKRQGIYADINLHISRNYWEGEDFPDGLASNRERQEQLPNYGKAIDKINDQMIRMQRDYARALLTHVNAYTHASYAKEPCVAIVEINNENSLLQLKLASLPEYYRADVLKKWNHWLEAHYGSTEKLAVAWGGREALGTNVLPARPSTQGSEYFAITNGIAGENQIHPLKALDGQPVARSRRLLLVAAGDVENTGVGWNADHTSVGTQWGRAPTICEGIAAKVTLTTTAKAARVHSLDGNGARAGEVTANLAPGKLSFTIGPQFKTLWYEIVVE